MKGYQITVINLFFIIFLTKSRILISHNFKSNYLSKDWTKLTEISNLNLSDGIKVDRYQRIRIRDNHNFDENSRNSAFWPTVHCVWWYSKTSLHTRTVICEWKNMLFGILKNQFPFMVSPYNTYKLEQIKGFFSSENITCNLVFFTWKFRIPFELAPQIC